ncbi:MAG: PDDEXK nuclease domain-containing protein [Oscillospiraceae bacterium]|nr:PDDEXK nuclease domain-containing protein [Oscillospiraceae bacterium]
MGENKSMNFDGAVNTIKEAIIRSRYQAAKLINKELLGLYYAVGKYVSDNSRNNFWGQGAIHHLSCSLQKELPGLRGFSESSIKRMREFYEQWASIFSNRPLTMGDFPIQDLVKTESAANNGTVDLTLLAIHMDGFIMPEFSADDFYKVGFTHHSEILAKEKTLDGRLFYIAQCAEKFWTVDALKSNLRGELYYRSGTMSNNFLQTLPELEQAKRAIKTFKDEYFLDFINIEDESDPDERVIERGIISNIKQFILSFGNNFCFIGNQYRVMVDEQEFFIDLLFYNRELRCLVAVELKRGEFKPSQLGQLNFYLSALDEYVKLPGESPSIGILLCKNARRNIVEFAVRDYTKPMGVATYKTRNEMPEQWQKALPDFEDIKKVLNSANDEQISEIDE